MKRAAHPPAHTPVQRAHRGRLETARTTEQRARAEYDRTVGGPTPEDLAWLETQTRLAEIALEQARAPQAQTDLRAPFVGTVVQVQPRAGENVNGYSPLVTDQALQWLDHAIEQRSEDLAFLLSDPAMDPLRSDPRFTEVLRKVGFSPADAVKP